MTRRVSGIIVALCVLFSTMSYSSIRHVPGSYASVQTAINAAQHGDTVLVDPGTYFENLNFKGKNIVVSSYYLFDNDTSFISGTVINGSQPTYSDTGSCVLFISGETPAAVLQGFTLTGGTGTRWPDSHTGGFYREGGGILTENSSPTIQSNRIAFNDALNNSTVISAGGGAIRSDNGNPRILNNVIEHNRGRYGAGIVLNYTGATIRNNIIAHNSGGDAYGGSGIWANETSPTPIVVENNTIVYNSSSLDGGGVLVWNTTATLRNNIIWGNTAPTGPQISLRPGGTADVTSCDVEGGWSGSGNINASPEFECIGYYLKEISLCIDRGNASPAYDDPEQMGVPGSAAWPSRGTTRDDIGAYGGPGCRFLGIGQNLGAPQLALPANGATEQLTMLTFAWHPTSCGAPYHFQIGTDSTFAHNITIDSSEIPETSLTVNGIPDRALYFWRVQSADTSLLNVWSAVFHLTVGGTFHEAHFDEGWNLISLPLVVNDYRATVVFPPPHSPTYWYDGNLYRSKDTLANDVAYWMRFPSSQSISFIGHNRTEDTVDVRAGWNMIGTITEPISISEMSSLPSDIIESFVYGFSQGYVQTDSIVPFRGYWVRVNTDGKLILRKIPGMRPFKQHEDQPLNLATSLTIVDASGHKQILLVGRSEYDGTTLSRYDLPPIMPETFDARFSSGRFLEVVGENVSKEFPVIISSAEYPLVIRWNVPDQSMKLSLRANDKVLSFGKPSGSLVITQSTKLSLLASSPAKMPHQHALMQNYPNPFNPTTQIQFELPKPAVVGLKVYNMMGQEVATLLDHQEMEKGTQEVEFNARNLASGVYFYRMTANQIAKADDEITSSTLTMTKKMLFMK